MLCNFRVYLSLGLMALLFSGFFTAAHAYGMECEKPTIVTAAGITSSFSFDCKNSTTSAHFASYEIFPVCTKDSSPAGICDNITFTATGCASTISPGEICTVEGSFTPTNSGVYILDFNDRYGSVTYSNIFCNDPSKGCVTADATPFAYVTPFPITNLINQCPVNMETGEFSSCATAYDGSDDEQRYTKITFAIVNGSQYAYVTDQHDNDNGFVYKCTIIADGSFNSCSKTTPILPVGTNWAPYAIAFATVGSTQYAYVTDVNMGYTYQCLLDSSGNFTSCTPGSQTYEAPYAIDFATVNGTQYAYIGNAGNGLITSINKCLLNNDGTLGTCIPTRPANFDPDTIWIPYGLDFATVDGIQYAYIADNGNGTVSSPGQLYQCTLIVGGSNNGNLDECFAQERPTDGWTPVAIAIPTLNGTPYAYVGSQKGSGNGSMYSCTFKDDDSGSFDVCTTTPDSPPTQWAPTSIAFR